jgi:hypothetical protein
VRKPPLAPLLRDYEDDDSDQDDLGDLGLDCTTVDDDPDAQDDLSEPVSHLSHLPGIAARHTVDRTIVGYRQTRLPEPIRAPGSRYCLKHPVKLDDPVTVVIRWGDDHGRSTK